MRLADVDTNGIQKYFYCGFSNSYMDSGTKYSSSIEYQKQVRFINCHILTGKVLSIWVGAKLHRLGKIGKSISVCIYLMNTYVEIRKL
jgi:hypothetical protein